MIVLRTENAVRKREEDEEKKKAKGKKGGDKTPGGSTCNKKIPVPVRKKKSKNPHLDNLGTCD